MKNKEWNPNESWCSVGWRWLTLLWLTLQTDHDRWGKNLIRDFQTSWVAAARAVRFFFLQILPPSASIFYLLGSGCMSHMHYSIQQRIAEMGGAVAEWSKALHLWEELNENKKDPRFAPRPGHLSKKNSRDFMIEKDDGIGIRTCNPLTSVFFVTASTPLLD